jgi:site-specific DNA recombinase
MSAEPISQPSKLAVYMRVSSDEQREQGTIKSQRSAAERYLSPDSITPYSWYIDDGVSGTLDVRDRPEGRRLLADVAAGHVTTVVFHKLDRMGRSLRVLMDARDALLAAGCELVSINEHLDTSNAAGRMFFNQLGTFAEFERDTILERSAAGNTEKARAGTWMGGSVPFGYLVVGKKKDARLVLDETPLPGIGLTPVELVQRIYRRLVDEGWSCQRIADELNASRVPTATGVSVRLKRRPDAVWRPTRVYNLVHQTTYKGLHQYGKKSKSSRPLIEREVPAIVDVATWERAQDALHANLTWSPRNTQREYLLRALVRCAHCGLAYQGTCWRPGAPTSYYCRGHKRAHAFYGSKEQACRGRAISGAALEAKVWAQIEGWLRDPGEALDELAARLGEQADQTERLRAQIAEQQQELQQKQTEKDSVIALYRRGRIDAGDLDRQLDQIADEEAAATRQIALLQEQAAVAHAVAESLHSAEALLRGMGERLDTPEAKTFAWRRKQVETLVQSIVVTTTEDATTGKRRAHVDVWYRFASRPTRIVSCTKARADTPSPHPGPVRPAPGASAGRRPAAPSARAAPPGCAPL